MVNPNNLVAVNNVSIISSVLALLMYVLLVSESVVLRELKAIQTIAVQAYNAGDLQESEKRFIESLAVLQMIYPPNHPDVIKAEKSVSMVQSKIQSLQK